MKCEKCRKEVKQLEVLFFLRDGSDEWMPVEFEEPPGTQAVAMLVPLNWVGDELDGEEEWDTIRCPYCHEYPFKSKEIHTSDYVEIVCFKEDGA